MSASVEPQANLSSGVPEPDLPGPAERLLPASPCPQYQALELASSFLAQPLPFDEMGAPEAPSGPVVLHQRRFVSCALS